MPHNLQAAIRYNTIDECLQRRQRRWTWRDLAEACGDRLRELGYGREQAPSRRTIMSDIAHMRNGSLGYMAPIVFDQASQSYAYADPRFSIHNGPLSADDLHTLRELTALLRQFRHWSAIDGLMDMVTHLEDALRRQTPQARTLIEFDHLTDAPGRQWLDPLYRALVNRQCLWLTYRPFEPVDYPRRAVSPYLLKEYNKRWFLIGHDHVVDQVQNWALDRILQVEDNYLQAYYDDPRFRAEHWFQHCVGVSRRPDDQPVQVRLRTTARRADYLRTKPLHHSQRETERQADYSIFTFDVILNFEWTSLLLALGDEVVVLDPPALRAALAERLRRAAENYHSYYDSQS